MAFPVPAEETEDLNGGRAERQPLSQADNQCPRFKKLRKFGQRGKETIFVQDISKNKKK